MNPRRTFAALSALLMLLASLAAPSYADLTGPGSPPPPPPTKG